MSTPKSQSERLQELFNPFLQTLPQNVLLDLIGTLAADAWSHLLAEGRPIPDAVAGLLKPTTKAEVRALTTQVLFTDFKNRCLKHAWRTGGLNLVKQMIRCPDADRLQEMYRNRQPAVFVFSHFGPRYAIAPAFQQVGVPVAMYQGVLPVPLRKQDVEQFAAQLPGMEYYWIGEGPGSRAANLKRGIERLQRGGMIATAIDGGHGDVLTETSFFGHQMNVARGPAVLARLARVPLIPITVTWDTGWSMEFRIHDPIQKPDGVPSNTEELDVDMTRRTMQFFDAYIRQHPEQLRLDKLARLITLPRVDGRVS